MTIKELKNSISAYPDDYIVVISKHKGEGAIIAIAPEAYQESQGKANKLYHVMPDRRERQR